MHYPIDEKTHKPYVVKGGKRFNPFEEQKVEPKVELKVEEHKHKK
jgi:hypothetical protein